MNLNNELNEHNELLFLATNITITEFILGLTTRISWINNQHMYTWRHLHCSSLLPSVWVICLSRTCMTVAGEKLLFSIPLCNTNTHSSQTIGKVCCLRWVDALRGLIHLFLMSQAQNGTALQLKPTYFGTGKYFLFSLSSERHDLNTQSWAAPARGMSGISWKWTGNIFPVKPHQWGHITPWQGHGAAVLIHSKPGSGISSATFLCKHAGFIGNVHVEKQNNSYFSVTPLNYNKQV